MPLKKLLINTQTDLQAYTPQAVAELKKALWKGTEDWDNLLEHNAEVSGRLVLSERTQQTLHQH